MRRVARIAAAVLLAAGLFYAAGSRLLQPALAFHDVAQKLRDARTLTYHMTMQLPGTNEPVTTRLLFMEPGLIRAEGPRGHVVITSLKVEKTLILDPKAKTAVLMEGVDGDANRESADVSPARLAGRLRNLVEKGGVRVGQRRIGGVLAQGFRIEERGKELTVWGDPKTRLPVLIENAVQVGDIKGQVTLSDFVIDPPLDEALFRLDPPEGYVLQKLGKETLSPEEAVARLLRTYAENTGGAFPDRLDDWAAHDKVLRGKPFNGPTDPDLLRLTRSMTRVMMFIHEEKTPYGYQATGVKLGDADKIVFWYRPQAANMYRVVFGDLHVGDATADRLPTPQPNKPRRGGS
jgi:outer membrane lipoprotein-sorting protein